MAHSARPAVLSRLIRTHSLLHSWGTLTRPLLGSWGVFRRPLSDEAKNRTSSLSRSTLFLQNGISIQELPILIRKLNKSLIPVTTNKLSLDDIQKISEQEQVFKMKLQDCSTAKDVFKLLEIPAEQVTPYTAAFALDRLCQLQTSSNNDLTTIHSFIRDAVLKELCDTITRGVDTLTSETLISMIRCSCVNSGFPKQTQQALILEVERGLSESRFSINQLCEIIHSIHHDNSLEELVDNLHIHLGSRTDDMDSKNVVKVYESLSLGGKSTSAKSTLALIEPVLINSWWQLSNRQTATLMTSLVHLNYKSVELLAVICKLMFLNIQNFDLHQLKKVVFAYIHFNFSNDHLFRALGKYATAKNENMDSSIVALMMEYCRSCRHLSVAIFDAAATHVKKHAHKYTADELYLILRPFGQLNYLPSTAGPVFMKVEAYLTQKFDEFPPEKMIELLTSFAYIERFPINFVKKLFTPYTFSIVNNISQPWLRDAACRDLVKLQSSVLVEWRDCRLPFLFPYQINKDKRLDYHDYRLLCEMKQVLKSLLLGFSVYQSENLDNSPYILDFLIEKKRDSKKSRLPDERLAVLVTTNQDYTTNTHTPLGDYAMKLRHIRLKGLGIIEVSQIGYSRSSNRELYLNKLLQRYINSSKYT